MPDSARSRPQRDAPPPESRAPAAADPGDRGHLLTEQVHDGSADLDRLPAAEAVGLMIDDFAGVLPAIAAARPQIVAAVELVGGALARGGRLIYVGAGTSGRLGVLDAAECPPTFLSDPGQVQGVIAGGPAALLRSVEGAEDDALAGAVAMEERHVRPPDAVFGISAGGTTPFVRAALARARELGARTLFMACVPRHQAPDDADVSIRVLTGPELLAGSTRLKAGTATKMVLNMVSTLAMVRVGKVLGNLMVDLDAGRCEKLRDRGARIVMRVTGLDRTSAADLLLRAGLRVKTALVMHARGVPRERAGELLERCGGRVREAMSGAPG